MRAGQSRVTEPVETLVERVRRGFPPGYSGRALAALIELAERLEAAEKRAEIYQGTWHRVEDAVRDAEARVAALEEALREIEETRVEEWASNEWTRQLQAIARAALRVEGDEKGQ